MKKPTHFCFGLFCLIVGIAGNAEAQFTGTDDFNGTNLDTTKWSPVIIQDATLIESSGLLREAASGGTNAPYKLATVEWKHHANPSSNWMAQVDVRMPFTPPPSNNFWMDLEVIAAPWTLTNAPYGDTELVGQDISIGVSSGSLDRSVVSGSWAYNENFTELFADRSTASIYSTLVSFRVRWDASEQVLLTEYDADGPIDGYHWTVLGCRHLADYGWNLNADFAVMLTGAGESVDDSPADNPGFDNFIATYLNTPPAAPLLGAPVIEGTSASMRFQAATQASYTLESKDNLDMPDWQASQSVLGNGSTQTVRDRGPLPRHRYYRLRIP